MKKPIVIIIVLIIIGGLVWYFGGHKSSTMPMTEPLPTNLPESSTAPVTETTKVSDKLSEYKNEELGFSVKYPSTWQLITSDPASAVFDAPTKGASNTVKKLESKILVGSGKCAFPPVTTIKDRTPLKTDTMTFNMISMSNSVQGSNYFDRMYSLQKDNICYTFSFSSIALSPASSGFKGSEATQVTNNNKALVDGADQAFTAMVKSFSYITGPVGQDETQVVPTKK